MKIRSLQERREQRERDEWRNMLSQGTDLERQEFLKQKLRERRIREGMPERRLGDRRQVTRTVLFERRQITRRIILGPAKKD